MTSLSLHPVTCERLQDLACFSQQHGKFRYCSCMRWCMRSVDFSRSTKERRAANLERLVLDGQPVGILAYSDGVPVAWCSVAPRQSYLGLERYSALARIDDEPVWAVVCFFVDRRFRRRGLTLALLKGAVAYAHSEGAKIIEGYPVPPGRRLYTYMGSPSTFRSAGFSDVTPPGATRALFSLSPIPHKRAMSFVSTGGHVPGKDSRREPLLDPSPQAGEGKAPHGSLS